MEKYTVDLISTAGGAWTYAVIKFSSMCLFNENKHDFCPIFIGHKDLRHIPSAGKEAGFQQPIQEKKKKKKQQKRTCQRAVASSWKCWSEKPLISASGAAGRTTSFVRLRQCLLGVEEQRGEGWNAACKNCSLGLAPLLFQKGKFSLQLNME